MDQVRLPPSSELGQPEEPAQPNPAAEASLDPTATQAQPLQAQPAVEPPQALQPPAPSDQPWMEQPRGYPPYQWQPPGQPPYPWPQAAQPAQPAQPQWVPQPQYPQPYPQQYPPQHIPQTEWPQQPQPSWQPPQQSSPQQPTQLPYPQQPYPQQPYPQQPYPQAGQYQLPPPQQSWQQAPQPWPQAPRIVSADQPVGALGERPVQTAVAPAHPALAYEIAREKRQSWVWRVIKWPIRNLLKGIYLVGSAAKRHRVAAVVLTLLVLLLGGAGYGVYAYTNPPITSSGNPGPAAAQDNTTPFTVMTNSQPPLAPGVILWLHAYKYCDGHELWSSLSPMFQQQLSATGLTVDQMNSDLQKEKQTGIGFDEFIYTGGYLSPDGTAHFTVEAIMSQGDQKAIRTWYFVTDQTGKILIFRDLTPGAQ